MVSTLKEQRDVNVQNVPKVDQIANRSEVNFYQEVLDLRI